MDTLTAKVKELGGAQFLENLGPAPTTALAHIEKVMGAIPEGRTVNFISQFGNSRFLRDVFAKTINKSAFLQSGHIAIGTLFGWGTSRNSILSIIQRYNSADQVNSKFLPLFEGYPGDIIYYSLEESSLGKIYYWYHESNLDGRDVCIANSLDDFIDTFFIKDETIMSLHPQTAMNKTDDSLITVVEEKPLSDDELEQVNIKRKKVGLPLIDKFKNII